MVFFMIGVVLWLVLLWLVIAALRAGALEDRERELLLLRRFESIRRSCDPRRRMRDW